jgi:hypothetical protein
MRRLIENVVMAGGLLSVVTYAAVGGPRLLDLLYLTGVGGALIGAAIWVHWHGE